MSFSFTKMHGLGNDFIVVDNTNGSISLTSDRIQALSDRRSGIGFDQLLMVEPATVPEAEFDYRIFNADGGEVEHCGNGARCFALFVKSRGMTTSEAIAVNTSAGLIRLRIQSDEQVTVDMGVPTFAPKDIPFVTESFSDTYSVDIDGKMVELSAVAIGNPHAVLLVDDVDTAPVKELGPLIENHPKFPNRVNVGFMQIIDRTHIRLRVFERGVGETRACGTGACAAVAVGINNKLLDKSVIVTLSGGDLKILWPETNVNIEMTGPCTTVFEGHTRM